MVPGIWRWPAPAKLNLFLHVTGRRPDGYHTLQTVFQLIDLQDEVEIEACEDGRIERVQGPQAIPAEHDLCVRAASLLRAHSGCRFGARIRLDKRIPMGGGLGGGSSDAASVLVALDTLWGLDLPAQELLALGLKLGADVPVFIAGQNAFAEGVGEILSPISLPHKEFLLIHPGVGVPTAAVFSAPELTRNTPGLKMESLISGFAALRNDCEPVVCMRYPEVARALTLAGRAGQARMSGSGSCVFAGVDDLAAARAVLQEIEPGWSAWIVRTLARSPLLDAREACRLSSGQG